MCSSRPVAFGEMEEDPRLAKTYFVRCLVCHDDIKKDMVGCGLVVQRLAKRRMGAMLRAALQSGDSVGSLVNVFMTVGRSVRFMPMRLPLLRLHTNFII